jgi:hypothetical protein
MLKNYLNENRYIGESWINNGELNGQILRTKN